jgi:hypothetical protein
LRREQFGDHPDINAANHKPSLVLRFLFPEDEIIPLGKFG